MITFSRTVSSLSRVSCCGTTPRRARMRCPSFIGSSPRMRSVPPLEGETQPIMRIVELLPAPFGPRKPNASPGSIAKSMPSTATKPAKRFVSAWASMSGTVTASDASGRSAAPQIDRRAELALRENRAAAGDADVRRAAHAELRRQVDLAPGCEPEGRITRARVFEVELDAQYAARERHAAGDDRVEH